MKFRFFLLLIILLFYNTNSFALTGVGTGVLTKLDIRQIMGETFGAFALGIVAGIAFRVVRKGLYKAGGSR